jgi:hypothetical protein
VFEEVITPADLFIEGGCADVKINTNARSSEIKIVVFDFISKVD